MNAHSLLASAGINIGLALVILTLFSLLKKQPSNAVIYYARRLSKQDRISFRPLFTLHRFIPSVSWIRHALSVSDDEILQTCGLDALVVIRLFKFGIKFFVPCSIVGLLILLPINYTCKHGISWTELPSSMDSFTISNVGRGSDRLWVHFCCLYFISFYGLYLLYEEYKGLLGRRLQHLRTIRHRPDQFTVLVREIPYCSEHKARSCSVEHFFSKYHPYTYQSCQIVYDGKKVEELLRQASVMTKKIEHLKQRATSQNSGHLYVILGMIRGKVEKIEKYEERLQELCYKIRCLQGENMLKQKELPVAFVSFKSRWGATLAAQTRQHVHPLLWVTHVAPEPRDVLWDNLYIPYHYLAAHKIGVFVAVTVFTVFFAIPVTAVQGLVQFEKIKKWFPPARAVQLIPGLNSILTGYLPSVVLNSCIYVVPYAMLAMAGLEGFISISKKEIRTCSMVFYFLVGNVFFLSLLSGSLLDQIGESFTHPRDFPAHLASAVSAQADFFITYILTDGLSGFSLEILQTGLIVWHFASAYLFCQGPRKKPYVYSMQYYRVVPFVSVAILIGMVYAVIAPLLLPFLVVYFSLGYVVYTNQIQDVYVTIYETCGQYWPHIHHYILFAIVLMQITMIGLFGLKSKPAASILTIPLLLGTLLFNEYCKVRFLPAFRHHSVQGAMENDELDEMENLTESSESPIEAYRQPCLRPMDIISEEVAATQPLLSSV
ncbi:CSC1-like protein At3g54510 isoform X2 [Aristolochia californica]|uniref:CSC1-like protein At3g54510 isoform X2 n=1 Tax=Aristolochia californica TaxID=171875 RepID=UPI0035D88D2E